MPISPNRAIWFTHDGLKDTVAGWADRLGIPRQRVYRRLRLGWTIEQALDLEYHESGLHGRGATVVYSYRGIEDTIPGWSQRSGIPAGRIRRRLERGWSFGQAIGQKAPPPVPHAKLISYGGITDSILGWARRLGVSQYRIARRLKQGESIASALDRRSRRPPLKPLTCRGKTLTIVEWARLRGINPRTIQSRLERCGWTVEQALGFAPRPRSPGRGD